MSGITEIVPIVIIASVVVIMVARRSRGINAPRGTLRPVTAASPAATGLLTGRLLPLPGNVGLVAAREFRERVRGRAFRIGTLLVLAVIVAAIVIPTLIGGKANLQRIGVVGVLSAPIRTAVSADGTAIGATVTFVPEASAQTASTDLRAGRIDLAIVDGRQIVVDKPLAAAPTSATAELARAAADAVGTGEALRAARLTPAQSTAIAAARPLPVSSLQPGGPGDTQRTTSLVGLALIFLMLTQYNAWTLTGVLEEKSSRVVEVLLAALRPAQLLAGKVLGIGLAAFVQATVAVAAAILVAENRHSDVLRGTTPLTIAATLAWLVLGYAFYSWVYAAAGSMADRQDQVQSLAFPLALPVMFGYVMAFTTATSGSPSLFFQVLAYLPPTAPFAMPVLVSLGAVTWWQFAVAAVISAAATVGVARIAATIYTRAILRTGRRVRLRELVAR